MTTLDEFFGPKQPSRIDALAKGLQSGSRWQCEDRIRPGLDAWADAMGPDYLPQSAQGRRMLYAGMRALVNETSEGEAPSFIHFAAEHHRRHGLTVKGPRSFLHLLPSWRALRRAGEANEPTFEERGRYLKGRLAE